MHVSSAALLPRPLTFTAILACSMTQSLAVQAAPHSTTAHVLQDRKVQAERVARVASPLSVRAFWQWQKAQPRSTAAAP